MCPWRDRDALTMSACSRAFSLSWPVTGTEMKIFMLLVLKFKKNPCIGIVLQFVDTVKSAFALSFTDGIAYFKVLRHFSQFSDQFLYIHSNFLIGLT